jgi:hypothetical protein
MVLGLIHHNKMMSVTRRSYQLKLGDQATGDQDPSFLCYQGQHKMP